MTTENDMYGPGWKKCDECGVVQEGAGLVHMNSAEHPDRFKLVCTDVDKCARWKAEIKARTR